MKKKSLLNGLASFLFVLFSAKVSLAANSDPILALAFFDETAIIRSYDVSGTAKYEVSLPLAQVERIISAKWAPNAEIAAISQFEKTQKIRIVSTTSAILSEFTLPAEPINTLFAADVNFNSYADLVVIVHNGTKAKAYIYADPGLASNAPGVINLPVQALYYAPAVAGNSAIGFLAYNPPGSQISSAKSKRSARKVNKRKKKKNKKDKKVKGKNGVVYHLDLGGNIQRSFNIAKAMDGQVLPFSPDGTCGFGIRNGAKLKLYDHNGTYLKDVSLGENDSASIGDFSGAGSANQIAIGAQKSMTLTNLVNGAGATVPLGGLPDQLEKIEAEIARVNKEFLDAFRNNAPISELMKLRDELLELQSQKNEFSGSIQLGDRLTRIFTGGAGAIEGVCDVVYENPRDGYGGFLAKNGDYSSKIVILTPGGKNYVDAELVKFKSYKVITKLRDSGYGNPDSRGMRKHWRGDKTLQAYGKFIFRARYKSNPFSTTSESHCWFIKESASRID